MSPVPKKRGPGRPRKYPRSSDSHQQPRKRGRPRKHPHVSDEDAFSSENEFSVGGEGPEREHTVHPEEAMTSAATKIQSHWKKSKGKPIEGVTVVETQGSSVPGEMSAKPESLQQLARPGEAVPPPQNQSKPVTPPAIELIEWMRNMPIKRARKSITPGLRVKVRFVTNNKVKKDGKVTRKRIWYGGRVTAVSKEGSKSTFDRSYNAFIVRSIPCSPPCFFRHNS